MNDDNQNDESLKTNDDEECPWMDIAILTDDQGSVEFRGRPAGTSTWHEYYDEEKHDGYYAHHLQVFRVPSGFKVHEKITLNPPLEGDQATDHVLHYESAQEVVDHHDQLDFHLEKWLAKERDAAGDEFDADAFVEALVNVANAAKLLLSAPLTDSDSYIILLRGRLEILDEIEVPDES